ncbi:NAD-dependent epimerase/dehydratase family protein [Terrabacter aerolatus]|uniref:NAD-dependent epimerase n=1 Tax=Terrabacter aerolatus TaxID=422442 RepID=A0A512D2L3_9MICO|nr:saccharopine dehydrogenase NADP-binding domain-containing protein [Terrabacter aerolatus]GEO30712.1 NAD-dependent epimerase [Terrabacter aerolatus]
MSHHLVLGAGGVGRSTTTALVELGDTVTLASRSGHVSQRAWEEGHREAVEVVAVDAGDAAALTALARGAASIVNAVNPPSYMTWDTDWPPIATATLTAAEQSGAGLVIIGNLYGYGEVAAPMREDDPLRPAGHKGRLRADMWTEALARHEEGRLRVTELRSSDYFGPGTTARTSYLNDIVIDALLAGRPPFVPAGRADAPHSWTYVPDVGRFAARVAGGDDGWGRAWHVPTAPARTFDEAAADVARLAGVKQRRVRVLPRPLGTAAGLAVPFMRELRETRHQFERPFVLDSELTQRRFGLAPTPWDDALATTIADRRALTDARDPKAARSGTAA